MPRSIPSCFQGGKTRHLFSKSTNWRRHLLSPLVPRPAPLPGRISTSKIRSCLKVCSLSLPRTAPFALVRNCSTIIRPPMSNDIIVRMVEAMGGNVKPMASARFISRSKPRVVEGVENNPPSYKATNHFEIVQFFFTYCAFRHS